MSVETYPIGGLESPLPETKFQFTAVEAYSILKQVEDKGIINTKRAILSMINYSSSPSTTARLIIPRSYSCMSIIFRQFKINPRVSWSKKDRPHILDNTIVLKRIKKSKLMNVELLGMLN